MFSRRHFHGCRMFSMQQATGQIQAAFQAQLGYHRAEAVAHQSFNDLPIAMHMTCHQNPIQNLNSSLYFAYDLLISTLVAAQTSSAMS
jgi:hypothetical protein